MSGAVRIIVVHKMSLVREVLHGYTRDFEAHICSNGGIFNDCFAQLPHVLMVDNRATYEYFSILSSSQNDGRVPLNVTQKPSVVCSKRIPSGCGTPPADTILECSERTGLLMAHC